MSDLNSTEITATDKDVRPNDGNPTSPAPDSRPRGFFYGDDNPGTKALYRAGFTREQISLIRAELTLAGELLPEGELQELRDKAARYDSVSK